MKVTFSKLACHEEILIFFLVRPIKNCVLFLYGNHRSLDPFTHILLRLEGWRIRSTQNCRRMVGGYVSFWGLSILCDLFGMVK